MMSGNKPKISVLGMGQMGRAMAVHLSEEGWAVHGYNRTWHDDFDMLNVPVTTDLGRVGGNHAFLLSLLDEHAIKDLLFEHDEVCGYIEDGSVVIDTTTHNPEFAKTLSQMFRRRNIRYLDAPVSGGPRKAAQGQLAIMVGGDRSIFDEQTALLNTLGEFIYYMGSAGRGQATKLVNQVLVGIGQLATAEAIALGTQLNVDMDNLVDVIERSAGDSVIFRRSAPQMISREYSHEFQSHLIAKDLREICSVIDQTELDLPVINLVKQILVEHEKSEFRTHDAASIVESYSKPEQDG